MIDLAAEILSSFFFDPENEEAYQIELRALRETKSARLMLIERTLDLPEGECELVIEALRTPTAFSIKVEHTDFTATIEGLWDFEQEELRKAKVVSRTGAAKAIIARAEEIADGLDEEDIDEEELQDLMEALEDNSEFPVSVTIPRNRRPPPRWIVGASETIAKRLARDIDAGPNIEDSGWLEQMPQVLPVMTDLLVAEASATGTERNEALIAAYQDLLARQLEFVRYRMDAGWEWAIRMLNEYQHRLIALGEAGTIPQSDWFAMAAALSEARVPISDEVQVALANAGFKPEEVVPDGDMMETLRAFLDQLADMVSSPSEVIESLKGAASMMPAALRGFLATELALSPHQVLRDSVPLMLLDADSEVRRDAAHALEQSARPATLSPEALRRTITVRSWLPPLTVRRWTARSARRAWRG